MGSVGSIGNGQDKPFTGINSTFISSISLTLASLNCFRPKASDNGSEAGAQLGFLPNIQLPSEHSDLISFRESLGKADNMMFLDFLDTLVGKPSDIMDMIGYELQEAITSHGGSNERETIGDSTVTSSTFGPFTLTRTYTNGQGAQWELSRTSDMIANIMTRIAGASEDEVPAYLAQLEKIRDSNINGLRRNFSFSASSRNDELNDFLGITINYNELLKALGGNTKIPDHMKIKTASDIEPNITTSVTVGDFKIDASGIHRITSEATDSGDLWDHDFLEKCVQNGGVLNFDGKDNEITNPIQRLLLDTSRMRFKNDRFLIYRLYKDRDIFRVVDMLNLKKNDAVFNGLFQYQGEVSEKGDRLNLGFIRNRMMLPLIAGLLPQFLADYKERIAEILGVDSNTDGYQTKMNQIYKILGEMANRDMDTYQFTPTGMGINTTTLVSVNTKGHQMMMSVTKTQDDQFSVVLHNTGSGLEHHTGVEGKPGHFFKGQQAILTADQLSRLLAGTHPGQQSNINVKEFYDLWKELTNNKVEDERPGPAQTGKNCVSMSVLEAILYELAGHNNKLGQQLIALFMEWRETPLQSDFKNSAAGVIRKLPPPAPDGE